MITLTATVRPVESLCSSPVLGENLRQHYEHTPLFTGQMFVVFPGVGAVLVTEKPNAYRFDIVGNDQATINQRVIMLESAVHSHVAGIGVRFRWEDACQAAMPF